MRQNEVRTATGQGDATIFDDAAHLSLTEGVIGIKSLLGLMNKWLLATVADGVADSDDLGELQRLYVSMSRTNERGLTILEGIRPIGFAFSKTDLPPNSTPALAARPHPLALD